VIVHVGYFATIGDGPVARFRLAGGERDIASASRDGVVVATPRGVWSVESLALLRILIDTAERVHVALASTQRGLNRRTDSYAVIVEALGPGWTLEHPGIFEKWPSEANE
jgi:hypothetical protein